MVHRSSVEKWGQGLEIGRGYEEYQDKVRGKRRGPDYCSWGPEDMDGAVGIQRYAGRVKAFLPYNRVKVAINSPWVKPIVVPRFSLTHPQLWPTVVVKTELISSQLKYEMLYLNKPVQSFQLHDPFKPRCFSSSCRPSDPPLTWGRYEWILPSLLRISSAATVNWRWSISPDSTFCY